MAEKRAGKATKKSPRGTAVKGGATTEGAAKDSATAVFTAEERAAMRAHVQEQKAAARRRARGESDEGAVLAAIAGMPEADRAMGERLHAIIRAAAPELAPRLWYGMPAWARGDGKAVCFFQGAAKFRTRYATLGFSDAAALDDGPMWPTSYALTVLAAADEARIADLVRRAVG